MLCHNYNKQGNITVRYTVHVHLPVHAATSKKQEISACATPKNKNHQQKGIFIHTHTKITTDPHVIHITALFFFFLFLPFSLYERYLRYLTLGSLDRHADIEDDKHCP